MKRFFLFAEFIFAGATTYAEAPSLPIDTTKTDTLRTHSMLPAIVRAARPEESETNPVQSLEAAQLQRLSAHSVADAIRYFSGIQIKDYGGIGGLKTINVHGVGSEHTGVIYNGVRIENAQNGQIDLGRFSLDNIESVALYTGGQSDVLQPARNFASASTVYLQTRTPRFAASTNAADSSAHVKTYNIKGAFRTGSFGVVNPSFAWEQRLNADISSSVSAEYLYSSGCYRYRYRATDGYDTTATRHNGDINAVRAEAALFGAMPCGKWSVQGYVYQSRRGLPGAVVRNRLRHIDRQHDLNTFAQASLQKRFDRYSLLVNAKYTFDRLRYMYDPRLDGGTTFIDSRYKQREAYISAAQRYEITRNWSVALSADYAMNGMEADISRFARPLRHAVYCAGVTAWHSPRFSAQADVLLTHVSHRLRHKTAESPARYTEVTPAVMVSCRPFAAHNLTFRALYKKIFRLPTLNDLYYTDFGNSNLKPEYTTQYNAGITYRRKFTGLFVRAAELKIDGYYNKVTDKIIAVPAANMFRWTMMNIGLVKILGTDVSAQADCRAGELTLTAKATYTYQRAQDCSNKDSRYYKGQIAYIPRHAASFTAALDMRKWTLDYSFLYTGTRYDASANIRANRIHPWRTHDAALSRLFAWGQAQIKIMLAVNNIFNQQYEVVRCYPMPGRNYKVSLTLNV